MNVNLDIQKLQYNLELTYLNNLIKACDKNNVNTERVIEKINELNKDNKNKSETNNKSETHNKSETKPIIRNTSNGNLSTNTDSPTSATNQFSDDYLYQKPWTKLTAIHKIIKIKEFVNSLIIKEEVDKIELKEKLVTMIKNKLLTKKDSVLYDPVKCKVISVPLLQFKNGKYVI